MNSEQKYPIKAVENLTGLTAFVIRAWEKRYHAVDPDRTDTNRRLYSNADVEKLKLLSKLRDKGYNIGSIANHPLETLREIYFDSDQQGVSVSVERNYSEGDAEKVISDLLDATKSVDYKKFENLLLRASIEFSHPVLLQNIIAPFTTKIGELWRDGVIRVAEEHFASYILMKFLTNIRDSYDIPESAPKMLVTTPRGQFHEIGALMAAAAAAFEGWKVIYFSPNLPVSEIVAAVERIKAKALGLSIVYPFDDLTLRQDLQVLQELIPSDVKIILGGNAAGNFKDYLTKPNTYITNDLNQFRDLLKLS